MTISIFDLKTAFVNHLGNFMAVADKALLAGVRGLSINLYDGDQGPDGIGSDITIGGNRILLADLTFRRNLVAMGFSLGGWVKPRYHPERTAQEFGKLYGTLGLSFADIEMEYEYKSNGGKVDTDRFCSKWRGVRPKAYTSITTYGYPDTAINWKPVIQSGFYYKPEYYYLTDSRFTARACIPKAKELGWDVAKIKPICAVTFPINSDMRGYTLEDSLIRALDIRDLTISGKGWNMYLGENASDRDWEYARLIQSL